MVKKALLIGINYIGQQGELRGCINDVENISKVLKDQMGYKSEDIIFLRDDLEDPSRRPTGMNIFRQLISLANESSKCEEVWIHYSGHGSYMRDYNGDEKDGRDELIVPVDYQNGVLRDDELNYLINRIKCRCYVVMDCCHSGTILDLPYSIDYDRQTDEYKIKKEGNLLKNKAIYLFSGCQDSQTSADVMSSTGEAFGAMSNSLLNSLQKTGYQMDILELLKLTKIDLKQKQMTQDCRLSISGL